MNPPKTLGSKSRTVLPTTTLTPKNAKTNNYASRFGSSRLANLVSQAFDLRGTPYLPDASEAVVDEWRRLRLVWRAEENLWCADVLRRLNLASSGIPEAGSHAESRSAAGIAGKCGDTPANSAGLEGANSVSTAGKSSATEPVDRAGLSVVAQPSPSTHLWWAA